MRMIRFLSGPPDNRPMIGRIRPDGLVEVLAGSVFAPPTPTGETLPRGAISAFLPPVDPPNIFALGKNYADHAREFGGGIPGEPVIFLKATTTVIPHQAASVLPRAFPNEVDFGAELPVVIGKTAKEVSRAEALDCVLGYTCANDVTQRRCQKEVDTQWARAKSFDTFCPLGPVLVTDIDPADLMVRLRLNGQIMQEQSTRDLLWDIPSTIELLSRCFTLLPGTVILTGTPAGVGGARTPPIYLRPGDRVAVEIEGVGVLENPVVGPEADGCAR